ncbi:MAG: PorT family protein [Prevotellaceae bacterium]|nr:PorT family protein [Prevotellaceae bacterium]
MYNHETEVQQSDWEIISERIKRKRHRKIIPLFYTCGTTGVAVALFIIMFLIKPDAANVNNNITGKSNTQTLQSENKNTKTAAIDSQNENTGKNNSTANKNKTSNIIANTNKPNEITHNQYNEYDNEIKQEQKTNENISKHVDKIEKINYDKITANSMIDEIAKIPPKIIIETAKTSYSTEKQKQESTYNKENNNDEWWNQPETEQAKEKNKNEWTLALTSGNNMGTGSVISNFTRNEQRYNTVQSDYNGLPPVMSEMPKSLKTEEKTDIKHKYPLNFGLRIKKSVGKRVIIKTGLSYSYFLSEFNNATKKGQQQIHYVGVPVGIEFLLWQKNNFNIYLSGEFASEKGILYIYRESTQITSDNNLYTTDNGTVSGLQFSTNAGLGISYNFIKQLGIYVEPNVVYYIKDNRQFQSFRTEKSFNFGLNIGLKYDF